MKEVKQSIFQNLAIRCADWNQMLQLEEMAKKEGVTSCFFSERRFNDGCDIFSMFTDFTYCNTWIVHESETELSFDQFIQSINQK